MGNESRQAHCEKGTNRFIAFMFACPGWFEEFHGRPASGDTGQSLHRLLQILRDWKVPDIPTREELTITNSWNEAMYAERDGDTLPTPGQISQTSNINRLKYELAEITGWVVCCGNEAQHAGSLLKASKPAYKVANIRHLGGQSVNQISADIYGLPIKDTVIKASWHRSRARLEVVARDLLAEMGLTERVPVATDLGQDLFMIMRHWGEYVFVLPDEPTKQQNALVRKTATERGLDRPRKVRAGGKQLRIYMT